ncbi:shikimate kinase [Priestia megaterium]|uniref:shikimate kinase n=1 Tax=Priestia megaterium TaxID=1404 RepID=UPI002E1B8930|nr:shikimate kinase [Priestia megaterium]
MEKPVILIGPICSGKTTVAEIISNKLNIPQCSIDDVRFDYYKEIGFSKEQQERIREKEGFKGVYTYWKPFEVHAVKRVLEDYPTYIHDFGAGHSVYEDESLLQKAQVILEKYENIFLLLPSSDINESINTLTERLSKITDDKSVYELNEHFIRNKSNRILSKHTIYTNRKSAEEVAQQIIDNIN